MAAAAEAAGVTERTVYRWLARWRVEGLRGLVDRRSVPGRIPHKTPTDRVSAICELRQLRMTAAQISVELQMPLSTVSAVLKRITGHQPGTTTPSGLGWEAVHVCIDDYSRLAYVEVLTDEKAHTSVGFLERAIAFFAGHGIGVERVMTDG